MMIAHGPLRVASLPHLDCRILIMASLLKRLPSFRRSSSQAVSAPCADDAPFDVQGYLEALEASELRSVLLALAADHSVVQGALERRSRERPAASVPVTARSFSSSKKRRAEGELDREEPPRQPALAQKQQQQQDAMDKAGDAAEEPEQPSKESPLLVLPVNEAAEVDELDKGSKTADEEQRKEVVIASPASAE